MFAVIEKSRKNWDERCFFLEKKNKSS